MTWRRLWRTLGNTQIGRTAGILHIFNPLKKQMCTFPAKSEEIATGKSSITISALIPTCNRGEDLEEARRLYEQMKEQGIKPDPSCFQALLDGYCRFGTPDETSLVISDMKEWGVYPDARAYSCLITSYGKFNMLDEAAKLFWQIRRDKVISLDPVLYSTMVWLYCRADRPQEAEQLLAMMHEDGKLTDAISYNVVISAYERSSCYTDAIRVFETLKNPGQSTYTLMLNVYRKAGDLEMFNRVLKKMQGMNFAMDINTMEATIEFYASKNRFMDAERFYQYVKKNPAHLSLKGYNRLMEVFIQAGNIAMVDRIHREMVKFVIPDVTTKRHVITAYLRAQSFTVAIELYEEIVKEGFQCMLDEASMELLARAYVRAGRFFEAMRLAVQMKKAGMTLNEELYKEVATGMVSVDDEDDKP